MKETYPIQCAVEVAKRRDRWLRPMSWKGSGMAMTIKDSQFETVPNSQGGRHSSMPDVGDICGYWEVVEPAKVIEENNSLRELPGPSIR